MFPTSRPARRSSPQWKLRAAGPFLTIASLIGAPAAFAQDGKLTATPSASAAGSAAPASAVPSAIPPSSLPAASPPADTTAKSRSGGAGLGLSPSTPQIGSGAMISAQAAQELTPTTSSAGADEWKFTFHGYIRGPMRFSWGPPTPTVRPPMTVPAMAVSGTQLHGKPRVPGASYIQWDYTNTVPDPWAQLNFSYGNSRAMMTVIVDSYGQTSAGYRNLQSQQGIDQAFLTLNFPEAFGERGGLVLNVGSFQNRYGTAGKYDAGMYETYLFGRTRVGGATLTANIDTGSPWGLTLEAGGGTKLEVIPFTRNQLFQIFKGAPIGSNPQYRSDRDPEGIPYPGPVPQGSTFLAHGHVGLAYKKLLTFGAHLLHSWTPDDNWDGDTSAMMPAYGNSQNENVSRSVPRVLGPTKGSMTIWGGDVRLNGGVYGDGYLGYSHINAKNINALADAIEVLHSFGGWQFKQNFFGLNYNPHTGVYNGPQNESGTVDTIAAQYAFSFASLARHPVAFWGDGPDLTVTVFGLLSIVNSPAPAMLPPPAVAPPIGDAWNMSTKKLKFGTDLMYTPLSWVGFGGRLDIVQPDLDAALARTPGNPGGSQLNFTVLSPRVVFRTAFVTHEAVTVMYQHYFMGNGVYPVYPYEWVAKPDADVVSISGTMWW